MRLPENVRAVLNQVRVVISFGIDGIPLACVGANGYQARLIFYLVAPMALVLVLVTVGTVRLCLTRRTHLIVTRLLPYMLRIFFLSYPVLTNVGFEAFSCFEFEDGSRFLISDVTIVCGTGEHAVVQRLAWIAIALYPIGIFILNAVLLATTHKAIIGSRASPLAKAIAFLHRDYKPTPATFWWELAESERLPRSPRTHRPEPVASKPRDTLPPT